MAISGEYNRSSGSNIWKLCTFWQSTNHTTSSSTQQLHHHHHHPNHPKGDYQPSDRTSLTSPSKPTVSSVARSFLPAKRRLRLDPPNRLYFPYEPGKQVRSAVRIKNTSKSYVAFKFQTTSPKSCYMRPPGGILAPGESLVATVFKFVEQPENNEKLQDLKTRVKFKMMSLKVKEGIEYEPELFEEQKDQATVERILRVVFLDPERSCSAMNKLRRQLAEADAAVESQKPPLSGNGPKVAGEGLVIDEWKERREKYLAQQQGEAVESV